MAHTIGPLHSLRAEGQFAKELIFKQKGPKSIVTHYSVPGSVKPFTPNTAQTKKRTMYGAAVGAWNNLSSAQKKTYNKKAKYKKYSGWNQFLKEYMAGSLYSYYGTRT